MATLHQPSNAWLNPATSLAARLLAAVIALAAWSGIILQFFQCLEVAQRMGQSQSFGVLLYTGFFTIITNLLVALIMTLQAIAPRSTMARRLARPNMLTMTTCSILLVGLGYHLLLSGIWNPQGWWKLADTLVHTVVPACVFGYALLTTPRRILLWHSPLFWSLYPLLYFVYLLIRGVITGMYPYPFVDVTKIGYAQALLTALVLWLAFVAQGLGLVLLNRIRIAPGVSSG